MKENELDWLFDLVKKGSCSRLAGFVKISALSQAKDAVWDFTQDVLDRARSIDETRLNVDWGNWKISPKIVEELQTIFLFYTKVPVWFGGSRNVKPQTVVPKVRAACGFLEQLLKDENLYDFDISLADIVIEDCEKCLAQYPGAQRTLKASLKLIFSAAAGKLIGRDMQIDAKTNLRLKAAFSGAGGVESSKKTTYRWLSDQQFSEASYSSLARVQDFLKRMNLPVLDNSVYDYSPPKNITKFDFRYIFELYTQFRVSYVNGVRDRGIEDKLESMGTKVKVIADYLKEVNMASQCVIGLYVGGRFSELASLKCGCREIKDGIPVVSGRVYKTKSAHDISDDTWVAIDVILDAVEALEALSPIKGSEYLFSPNNLIMGAPSNDDSKRFKGYSYSGFHVAMKRYFKIVNRDGLFDEWIFNSHQFKHSLTRQMVKAHLGMPYISFQLKHMYDEVQRLPSEVTMAYGNSASLLQSQMAGFFISEFKREKVVQIFSPHSPISGGGAAVFSERRDVYFEGMMSAGYSNEEIIDELGRLTNAVFVNVGLGYCTGRKTDPGGAKDVPCIGQLRCNPNKCKNAVITEEHIPAWQAVKADNVRMMEDPRFFYGKEQFETAIAEAEKVITNFRKKQN